MKSLLILIRVTLRVACISLALTAISLVLLRVAAPWPVTDNDLGGIGVAAASDVIGRNRDPLVELFVSVDRGDPTADTLSGLGDAFPGFRFQPMSARSDEHDRCARISGIILGGSCRVDNFVEIEHLTMPLWRTEVVRFSTAACGGEITLVRLFAHWRVISRHGICS